MRRIPIRPKRRLIYTRDELGVRPSFMSKELSYLEAIREALREEFGEMRVLDTPISESAIIGISIGAAMRGYRPVAEMQFSDFISCGFDQIVNQAATLRFRYGGRAVV